ncbi:MAG: PAS domain S-box protein [Sulfurimonas sp.]|nr:PAS domain S-box protein [Sulfurimonas sp.]
MKKKAFEVYVAIGSSAGGFEALSELVTLLPKKTGFFYFLAQHHARGEKTILAELLGRKSTIEVVLIQEGMIFKPDILYVLPPELKIIIKNNKLKVVLEDLNLHLPIPSADFLFSELCTLKNSKVIAIVLSGSGTDGTKGMRAVKESDGITVAEFPQEAMFESMPKSAINAKLVDYVLSVKDIGTRLAKLSSTFIDGTYTTQEIPFDSIVKILHKEKQLDLFKYKEETINRRIEKRMKILNFVTIEEYAHYFKANDKEVDILNQEVLIGVTEFFRGTESFEALKNYMKKHISSKAEYSEYRLWSVACSSGEEAYSLAILANEVSAELGKKLHIKIFATDIDDMALEKARIGDYKESALKYIEKELIEKYFIKSEYGYRVVKALRDQIIFAHHNFLNNPPFINMDLISCRNVLIYLKSSTQSDVFSIFHYSLKNDGLLFLGSSESTLSSVDLFVTLDNKYRIYEKKAQERQTKFQIQIVNQYPKKLLSSGEESMQKLINPIDIEKHLHDDLFDYFSSGCLIVDRDYNIVYKKGKISYLNFSDGILSLNIFNNLDKVLHYHMRIVINRVLVSNMREESKFIQMESSQNEKFVKIIAQPFYVPSQKSMILISFKEIELEEFLLNGAILPSLSENTIISTLSSQVVEARNEIQNISDELLFSKQNMSMINVELQDSNEKLQSTVEELETSSEELQSSNEELLASLSSNRELQNKLSLILESSIDGIVGLDIYSRHIFVNDKAAKMLGYSAEYLIGKSSHGIWHHTKHDGSYYPEEECPIVRTLSGGESARGEELFWRKNGSSFAVEFVRSPIVEDGKITGAVISFHDISEKKLLESQLKNEHEQMLLYLEVSGLIIVVLDKNANIVSVNRAGSELLGLSRDEIVGLNWFDNFIDKQICSEVKQVFNDMINEKISSSSHYINKILDANKTEHLVSWNNAMYRDENNDIIGVIAIGNDVTQEDSLAQELKISNLRYEQTFKTAQIGIAHVGLDGSWLDVNDYLCKLIGYSKDELLKLTFQDITYVDDLDKDLVYVSKLLDKKLDSYHIEKRYIHKGGNIIWVNLSVVLLRDSSDKPLYFILIIQDISQLKLLMLELESKKNELENVIRFAPNPIMLYDEDGTILLINEAFEEITGYMLKEIATIEAWNERALGTRESLNLLDVDQLFKNNIRVDNGAKTIITKGGEELVWIFSLAPLGDVYGGRRVVIFSAMDITEIQRKEDLMIAQSRQAAMGDMIGMIAHQWRQPLSIISMVANNLRVNLELNEEISSSEIYKLTDILNEQTQYLSHTIDDFRTFFKPEKAKEKIVLCKIYEKLVSMTQKILENNQITMTFINDCNIEFYTYPNELIQVMINLVNNAKDAIKERNIKDAEIKISTSFKENLLTIAISDNAGGIDKSVIDKLGEPYITTKSANGTGLGIYMSLMIIEKHLGGSMNWKNINNGSCFTIELPLVNAEEK